MANDNSQIFSSGNIRMCSHVFKTIRAYILSHWYQSNFAGSIIHRDIHEIHKWLKQQHKLSPKHSLHYLLHIYCITLTLDISVFCIYW